MKERCANIELLRILTMFLVVLHHVSFFGIHKGDAHQWALVLAFTVFTYWHVDLFVAISGWFGVKCTFRKFVRLWMVIAYYAILGAIYTFIKEHRFSVSEFFSTGWFVGAYFMVFLTAPIINRGLDSLLQSGRKAALGGWIAIAIAIVFSQLPFNGGTYIDVPGTGPYTAWTFVFIYITAYMINKSSLVNYIRCKHLVVALLIGFATIAIVGVIRNVIHHNLDPYEWFESSKYNAPHMIVIAVAVLVCFVKYVRVPASIAKIVGFVSPSMFGVYIIHTATPFRSHLLQDPQRLTFAGIENWPLVHMLFAAMLTFVISIVIDIVRRAIFSGISACFQKVSVK